MPTQVKKSKGPEKDEGLSVERLKELLEIVSRGKYMWESTFDAIRDPVLIIDRDYNIERANLEAARRAGRDIRGLVGQKCFRVFAQREMVCPGCPLEEVLRSKESRSVEIERLMPDRDFQVASYPLVQNLKSGDYRVVHHYRDITEARRLQRKLIQSEKMAAVGILASGVAHEINNPLAGILAFAQLLLKDLPGEGHARDDLKEIENAAKRCKKIVEDLLIFSRPHGEGGMQSISLMDEIEKILPLAKLNLRHKSVSLVTDYGEGLPKVLGNSVRLQQVFLNLIANAAQATPEGGTIALRLRLSEDRGHLLAEVEDHGCGISKEILPRIFDPFFTTKGMGEGTGLGLSICYTIISEHGGRIEVESEIGKGSLFRVVLPRKL